MKLLQCEQAEPARVPGVDPAPAARRDPDGVPAALADMIERHHLVGPVIGVIFDCGGTDSACGSETGDVIVTGAGSAEVVATFRQVPTVEDASGRPWRLPLAMLDDAFGGDAPIESLPLFRGVPAAEIDEARRQRHALSGVLPPFGVRRYFEALGTIGLDRSDAAFDGLVALEWNALAAPDVRGRYRYGISRASGPWQLDLRQAVRDVVFELLGGELPARISARFQNTIAAATADLVRGAACHSGRLPVVLTGSCLRTTSLAARVRAELVPDFQVVQEP